MIYQDLNNSQPFALLNLVGVVLVLMALTGCGGGGSAALPDPIELVCDDVSVPDNGVCRVFARRIDTRAATPFTENGQPVELEVVLYQPLAGTRFPTLVFNHGSTGNGSDPALFRQTFVHKPIAQYAVERGWMVAFVQRRGRGASDGLYDEGFRPDRSGYSCARDIALAGAARALDDIDAATDWLLQRPDVDTSTMLIGGTSRGGILSVAYLPRRPAVYRTAINFVGGFIGEGCGDYVAINRELFVQGASFPGASLWLYAENDSFYSLAHSRGNFDAFSAAGGLARFETLTRAPGRNGHFVINDADLWGPVVEDFLAGLGL